MSAFRPGQSARVAHSSLKAAISALEKAQNCAVLWFSEIMQRGLFRDLGYCSINQYAQQELGWSRTRTTDFIQLAQKLENLPEVKRQVASGELPPMLYCLTVPDTDWKSAERRHSQAYRPR